MNQNQAREHTYEMLNFNNSNIKIIYSDNNFKSTYKSNKTVYQFHVYKKKSQFKIGLHFVFK